jgi:hypothetical protein
MNRSNLGYHRQYISSNDVLPIIEEEASARMQIRLFEDDNGSQEQIEVKVSSSEESFSEGDNQLI